MDKPIRVLHVLGSLRRGGAESFIMNMYRNIDLNHVQFDFLTRGKNISQVEKEITQRGGSIYRLPAYPKHFIKNYRMLKQFMKKNAEKYHAVHVHANSLLYMWPLKFAKKYEIPVRIIHSHNTEPALPAYKLIHYKNRHSIGKYANQNLACSEMAGKWMFGKQSFQVIHNAIDLNKFTYEEETRKKYRCRLQVSDKLVIGTVGRMVRQKNQEFLLEIFYEISKKRDAVLLLIGEGELGQTLKNKAEELEILGKVIFMNNVCDVYHYLQAMDVFVMPSLYEGLSVSLVEAQATGIGVVMSDTVTKEAVLIDENVKSVSLSESSSIWADKVINMAEKTKGHRKTQADRISDMGFSIQEEVKRIEKTYGL